MLVVRIAETDPAKQEARQTWVAAHQATYAGSEMTPILGEAKDGLKTTRKSPKVLSEVLIYDVDLNPDLAGRDVGDEQLGARVALKDLGMAAAGIDKAVDLATANPYWNPRPLEREALRDLIARAHAGEPPAEVHL